MEGTETPARELGPIDLGDPLTIARLVQVGLALTIVVAAFVLSGGEPAASVQGRLVAPVTAEDEARAAFAESIADALGQLQQRSSTPLGGGFLGSDRGDVFASGTPEYQRSIADVLVEVGLLTTDAIAAVDRSDVTFLALQCEDRVGVFVRSTVEIPAASQQWWTDNFCARSIEVYPDWPAYLALSEPA